MIRAASITALAALAAAAAAPAWSATASAGATATIVDPANISVLWALQTPTVQNTPQGAAFVGNAPTLALGITIPGNAQLILRREDATGAPVTAPAGFQVSVAGREQLLVRTGATADVGAGRDANAIVGGAIAGGSAASIEVARSLTLASLGGPSLPTPEAALVVVVQYN